MQHTNPTAPKGSNISMRALLGTLAVLIAVAAVVTGVRLASSNSDIACSRTFTDEGACTNGAWSAWQTVSQTTSGCTTTVQEQRVYTGTREVITSSFNYRTVVHAACDINWANRNRGTVMGTITYQYAACQIQNDRTRAVVITSGTCAGTGDNNNTNTITSDTSTESTGTIQDSTSSTTTGSYADYLAAVDARLASASITAMPILVHAGEIVDVSWSASHVRSCTVVGTNGDTWDSAPANMTTANSQAGQQGATQPLSGAITVTHQSAPIRQQTIYTLTCARATGNPLVDTVTINIIPTFNEQ